jgi:hypothetical protein
MTLLEQEQLLIDTIADFRRIVSNCETHNALGTDYARGQLAEAEHILKKFRNENWHDLLGQHIENNPIGVVK